MSWKLKWLTIPSVASYLFLKGRPLSASISLLWYPEKTEDEIYSYVIEQFKKEKEGRGTE